MNPLILYTITPTLGLLRNYIKYKRCNFKTYIRTPLVYLMFHIWFCLNGCNHTIWKTLIFERWFWFINKSFISYKNNDYMKNKEKYIEKYKLEYKNNKNNKKVTFKD